jgi:hypothetical protein
MWTGSSSVWDGIPGSTGGRVATGVGEGLLTMGCGVAARLPWAGSAKVTMSRIVGNITKEVRKFFIDYPIE